VKYTAIVIALIGIVAAALIHASTTGVRQTLPREVMLAAAGVTSIVTAFLVSPFLFLDYQTALRDIAFETGVYRFGAMSDGALSTLSLNAEVVHELSPSPVGGQGLADGRAAEHVGAQPPDRVR
jgi:hypothetical protein